jgi:orotidine-5'-phosphate decarboxylase
VQAAVGERGTVAGRVLAELTALNGDRTPMGPFGAVVGATIGSTTEDLAINGPILAPGLGAQGGTPDDVARLFGAVARNVLPSTSRGVLVAGPDVSTLRDSAARVNAELVRSLQMYP